MATRYRAEMLADGVGDQTVLRALASGLRYYAHLFADFDRGVRVPAEELIRRARVDARRTQTAREAAAA